MAESATKDTEAGTTAQKSSNMSEYWSSFKAKAATGYTAAATSAKKLDDKTGFTATVSHASSKMGEKLSELDKKTGISKTTSNAVASTKTAILGGVGAARKSMRLWSNDLRFFDDNRLDTFKLFERFDKDGDGLLNDEEFSSLLHVMFQWFHTQKEDDQHYIPPKSKLESEVTTAKAKASSSWAVPEKGVDKPLFVSNWISFFSELESIHVTFRDVNSQID